MGWCWFMVKSPRGLFCLHKVLYMCYNGRVMKRSRNGWTKRQMDYIRITMNSDQSKYKSALQAGYSHATASHPGPRIEATEGFANARRAIALQAGEAVTAAVYEIVNHRDLSTISFENLLQMIKITADAMDKIAPTEQKTLQEQDTGNRLRTIVLQNVDTQNVIQSNNDTNTPEIVI